MAICDSCKRLAATPKRSDVPSHLSRTGMGSAADPKRANYRCLYCESQWRWIAPGTWLLILPPVSATAGSASPAAAGWWTALGQWIAGARARRRAPLDLRAPRLAPGQPARRIAPIVPPPASRHPDLPPGSNEERP